MKKFGALVFVLWGLSYSYQMISLVEMPDKPQELKAQKLILAI